MKIIPVKSLTPVRLDKYLTEQFPALTFGKLNKALRENKIKLNGKKQPLSTRVQTGDEIRLFLSDDQLAPAETKGPAFLRARFAAKPVYEDEHILLVDKPAGLPVIHDTEPDTLIHRAMLYLHQEHGWELGKGPAPALCHRLDTGTSGLVLIAKDPQTEQLLTSLIRERAIRKEYLCVTFGRPRPEQATLGGYLTKDAGKGLVRVSERPTPGGKEIETRYKTLAVSGRLALLQVELITGRTHQIRAHLASICCPILGDSKYGNNAANRELKLKYQALCAWQLTFPTLTDPLLQGVSGRSFQAEKPWWHQQLLEGKLK